MLLLVSEQTCPVPNLESQNLQEPAKSDKTDHQEESQSMDGREAFICAFTKILMKEKP